MSMDKMLEQLINQRQFGVKPGLKTIKALMTELGNPQDKLKVIHVAGTNGKGSVTAILDSILRAAGYKVGRYTSPHLISVAERFFVNGNPADINLLESAANKVFPVVEKLQREKNLEVTFFECLTAIAFVLFSEMELDVVLLETGLGGRLDATNIVKPNNLLVAIITRIGLDHCQWLGNTLKAIAAEKAGILKFKRPVVLGTMPYDAQGTIEKLARRMKCEVFPSVWIKFPTDKFSLFGSFQIENQLTALTAINVLKEKQLLEISDEAVIDGLENVVWPGRCQKIEKDGVTIIVDGAHNPDGATALSRAVRQAKIVEPICVVAGFCGDKDAAEHLKIMRSVADVGFAVPIRNERTMHPNDIVYFMRRGEFKHATACTSFVSGLTKALAWAKENNGSIVVCGSLFLAAEALVELNAFPWKVSPPEVNEKL